MQVEPQPLKGQTALVTGANSGIGAAIAHHMGAAGASVAVNYVTRPEDADRVVHEIREIGSEALAVRADVSDEDQVTAMFREVIEGFGTLDILVSNAGIQRTGPDYRTAACRAQSSDPSLDTSAADRQSPMIA